MFGAQRLRTISVIVAIVIALLTFSSCGQKVSFSMDDFSANENTLQKMYSFDANAKEENVKVNSRNLERLDEYLTKSKVDYGYSKLFDYEKALSGILVENDVKNHKCSVLDVNGSLTKQALFECVRKNNVQYLKDKKLLKDIDDDEFLLRICEIITQTTNDILKEYPQIDKERVFCNLGNLKIIEKTSALDFAAVEPGMVMHINRHTAQMLNGFIGTDSNMYNVLVHETMHIIQYGCECENVGGCVRRCGLAYSYSEREQDYSDWAWLAEASAERMASLYANVEPMTYKTHVNYLLSLDLITFLQEDIDANYVETLYFYDDVSKLFDLFGAKTNSQKQEIYKMIYSLEIMQAEPQDVKEAYKKHYGVEWSDEIRDDVNNKVKRPIVKTFTKIFYKNLINALCNNSISRNDVLFLVNLYESTINYHLRIDNSEYDAYNKDFNKWYKKVQKMFFDSLENISLEDYENYIISTDDKKLNATMKWLSEEKCEFLIEKFEDNLGDFKFR